jgi:hypothetical protein
MNIGRHLARWLVARHTAPAILAGTLALAAGGAAYLNPHAHHEGRRWCPPTGLVVAGTPLTGNFSYHRCDWEGDGR